MEILKHTKPVVLLITFILVGVISSKAQNGENIMTKMNSIIEKGIAAPSQNFTGTVWVNMNVKPDEGYDVNIGTVTFAPNARTNWHTHKSGQILFVIEGIGYYQEKGKPIQLIQKGDVVKIPKNAVHWHGASKENLMRHIALVPDNENDKTEWLHPVSNEEYAAHYFSQDKNTIIGDLTSRQQAIVSISSLTAIGNLKRLKQELDAGLDAGLTINEIKEIMVQLYAYCGFPRSLNAINTFMEVLEQRKARGINDPQGRLASPLHATTDKYEKGRKTLEVLTKTPQTKPVTGYGAFAPRIDIFLKEHLFADIFENDILDYLHRELVTISALSATEGLSSQLKSHLAVGKNTGITEAQFLAMAMVIEKNINKSQADQMRSLLGTN